MGGLVALGVVSNATDTYKIIDMLASGVFTFLPFFFAVPSIKIIFYICFFHAKCLNSIIIIILNLIMPNLNQVRAIMQIFTHKTTSIIPFNQTIFDFAVMTFGHQQAMPTISGNFAIFDL